MQTRKYPWNFHFIRFFPCFRFILLMAFQCFFYFLFFFHSCVCFGRGSSGVASQIIFASHTAHVPGNRGEILLYVKLVGARGWPKECFGASIICLLCVKSVLVRSTLFTCTRKKTVSVCPLDPFIPARHRNVYDPKWEYFNFRHRSLFAPSIF